MIFASAFVEDAFRVWNLSQLPAKKFQFERCKSGVSVARKEHINRPYVSSKYEGMLEHNTTQMMCGNDDRVYM